MQIMMERTERYLDVYSGRMPVIYDREQALIRNRITSRGIFSSSRKEDDAIVGEGNFIRLRHGAAPD